MEGGNGPRSAQSEEYREEGRNVERCKRESPVGVTWLLTIAAGETDWKVLAIDTEDPLAEKLNGELPAHFVAVLKASLSRPSGIGDIETHMPGFIEVSCEPV